MFLNPENFLNATSFLALYMFTFLVAKFIKSLLSPYLINNELINKNNTALGVSTAGYFIGVTAVYVGVFDGPRMPSWQEEVVHVGGYSMLGVFLLNFSRYINDKLILYKFSNNKEIIEDQNIGTGFVQAASYTASGLIIGGTLHSEGGSLVTSLAFFVFGQICLILFALLYDWLTPYSVHGEIEEENTAAGMGFAGGFIAIGIIVMKGVSGEFVGWTSNLSNLAFNIELLFIYLVFVRFFFDKILIPHRDLNKLIAIDKNLSAGTLEFIISISFSIVLFFIIDHQ